MNNLKNIAALHNHYFVMRHGQSKANLQGIIISHPENGTKPDYALTDLGRQQAKKSAEEYTLTDKTIIYSSDFSRANETANIVRETIGADEVHVTKQLRERHFGNWEKSDHANYHKVWEVDKVNADHIDESVESVNSVLSRGTALIMQLEKEYENKDILLVSHGDILQILQCGFLKVDPSGHRSLTHLETAEIRELELV